MDLPVGPGPPGTRLEQRYSTAQVFGGWQVSGITSAQTGQPFTVYNTAADFSGFNQLADRPDVVGTGPLTARQQQPGHRVQHQLLFGGRRPPARVGTSGRNQYYGPGLVNYDFTALKSFAIWGDRSRLTFRADFFNLFNHTNFSNPGHSQSNTATFGKITQTVGSAIATSVGTTAGPFGGPRQIQLALRLQF